MLPLTDGGELLQRLEKLVAAGGGQGGVFIRTGGAYYQVTGWVRSEAAFYLRTRAVLPDDVDPSGLLDYDGAT